MQRLGDVQARSPGRPAPAARTATSAGRAARRRVSATSTGVPSSTTFGDLAHEAGQEPVDDERRGVLDQHARSSSASCRRRTRWPAWRRRSARRATISSSGRTATGLKKWKPTTRSGCSSFDGHLGDRQRGGVGGQDARAAETTASTSAKTCCLTAISSKTASMTKSASAKASALSSDAGDQGLEPVGLVVVDPALAEQLVDLGVDVADALVDPLLVEVGQHDRHLEAARRTAAPAGWPSGRRRRCRPW